MPGWEQAIAQTGGDIGSAFLNNRFMERRQHSAQNYQTEMFKNRYQMQTADLQAAGLNPMLAYTQGAPGAPSSSGGSAAGMEFRGVESYNQSRLVSAQEANVQQDTLKKSAEVANIDADTLVKAGMPSLIAAQVVQANSSAAQADAMVKKIRAEIPEIEQKIKLMQTEADKNKSDIKLNQSVIQANAYLNSLRVAETYLTSTKSRLVNIEGDILEPKRKAAQTNTAEMGHIADNIGKIGKAAWSFIFPSFGGGESNAIKYYP